MAAMMRCSGLVPLLGFLCAFGWLEAFPALTAGQAHPNFVLVMTDDQGWGETGYYDHPVLETPNLDSMAANGLRFDRFYAAAPVCSPTRASVLTGRTPFRTGVYEHGWPLRQQEKTIAEALVPLGYATAHFGKWHLNGIRGPGVPILESDSHGPGAFGFQYWLSTTNFFDRDPILSRNGKVESFSGDSSNIIVREALKFIKRCRDSSQPFFVVIWDGSPHRPFVASQADRRQFAGLDKQSQHHYGELTAFDRSLGLLRRQLRELEIEDNTLLWFCSDNGGLQQVEPDTVGGLRGHKGTIWEGGIRVPAVLEWPGTVKPGVTSYPASTMDMAPTLAAILDLPEACLIQPVDGRSLVPLFDAIPQNRQEPIGILFQDQGAFILGDYKLVATRIEKQSFELYDLSRDPRETRDIARCNPDLFHNLKLRFDAWYSSVLASRAGEDYPAGTVLPGDPPRHFWKDDPRYESFIETWRLRPEYEKVLAED